jgi:hypothetical protein
MPMIAVPVAIPSTLNVMIYVVDDVWSLLQQLRMSYKAIYLY